MDYFSYLITFLVGGGICLLGQILVITTKMTSARILVTFLLLGVGLEAVGLFEPLKDFAGSGVTVPIVGFGASIAHGAIVGAEADGLLGVFTGGLTATAGGLAVAILSGYIFGLLFSSKTKVM